MIINIEFALFEILIAVQRFYMLLIQYNAIFFRHTLHFISLSFNLLNGGKTTWNISAICRDVNAKTIVLAEQVQVQCF